MQYSSERFLKARVIRKALIEFLVDNISFSEEDVSFLDVGCSEGLYVDYAAKNVSLSVGLEISCSKIKRDYDRKRGQYLVADAELLPFKEKSISLILCSETLEHLINPKACVEELFRVTKKYVVITTPIEIRTYWDNIKRKMGIVKELNTEEMPITDKGHLHEPDLKILDEWVSNRKWKIKKCFLVGPTWLEELKSPEQAKLVIDFPFLNKIRRLLKRLHKRLSIPLDEPEFIVLLLRKIN